jgi:hypothetical protein
MRDTHAGKARQISSGREKNPRTKSKYSTFLPKLLRCSSFSGVGVVDENKRI